MNLNTVLLLAALTAAIPLHAAEPAAPPVAAPPAASVPAAAPREPAARHMADRLDLDATVVTGNRELPKVLYIVPWKKAELGDLPEQPFNTLLDEALTPVDRDEFRREVSYYSKLADRAPASGPEPTTPAPATPAP